jgi:alkanesulfonate monooxygenase SsuD/methylene tetrahydromethanopterin reductase-like flavin-dependent oxidoreductase (luciferase family)
MWQRLVKDLMTLAVMSRGRLIIALGAGGPGFDRSLLGGASPTAGDRHDRVIEFCRLLDRPLTYWPGTWHGCRRENAPWFRPGSPAALPGGGTGGQRRTGQAFRRRRRRRSGDGWVTLGARESTLGDQEWWAEVRHTARRME